MIRTCQEPKLDSAAFILEREKSILPITPEVGETIVHFPFLPNGLLAFLGTKNLLFKIQVLCCQERGVHLLMAVPFYLVPLTSVLFGKKMWFSIQRACRNLKF